MLLLNDRRAHEDDTELADSSGGSTSTGALGTMDESGMPRSMVARAADATPR